MIDIFSLVVSHGLMAIAAWRLLLRDDLDADPGEESQRGRPGRGEASHDA
jgi:hypothetical protein